MSDRRPPQKSDQDNAEKAFQILRDCMKSHPQIEPSLWASAHFSCIATGCMNSGITYEEFSSELENVKEFYRQRWKDS